MQRTVFFIVILLSGSLLFASVASVSGEEGSFNPAVNSEFYMEIRKQGSSSSSFWLSQIGDASLASDDNIIKKIAKNATTSLAELIYLPAYLENNGNNSYSASFTISWENLKRGDISLPYQITITPNMTNLDSATTDDSLTNNSLTYTIKTKKIKKETSSFSIGTLKAVFSAGVIIPGKYRSVVTVAINGD